MTFLLSLALGASLGSAVKLGTSVEPGCECLNWKQTYAQGLVTCGKGLEFSFIDPEAHETFRTYLPMPKNTKSETFVEFTVKPTKCPLLHKLDTNKCLRTGRHYAPGKWYSSNWCYVSRSCMDVEAMEVPENEHVKLKLCKDGQDEKLSDMPVPDLMAWGAKLGIQSPGNLVDYAYPHVDKFDYAEAYLNDNNEYLQAVRETGETVAIGDTEGGRRHVVMQGPNTYIVPLLSYAAFEQVPDDRDEAQIGKTQQTPITTQKPGFFDFFKQSHN